MSAPGETAVLWFRRDLRLHDHAALLSASERADKVLALFVLDEKLLNPSGAPRLAFLRGCLEELSAQLDGRLLLVHGDPVREVVKAAASVGAKSVHVSADCAPYGRRRDEAVAKELESRGIEWVETGSPYAITPGRVTKPDGAPYQVFTAFSRAWREYSWPSPARTGKSTVDWVEPARSNAVLKAPPLGDTKLPQPGERAVLRRWKRFLDDGLNDYHTARDRPDFDATTRLSPYLHWGCVHPRTLLADLAERRGEGAQALRSELAWREFHADVLWHRPDAARANYDKRFDDLEYDEDEAAFEMWCQGRTGYPIVDAGMRQLLTEGWLHNRVRMIVASFLVKDLHQPWWCGARHFMRHLVDGDLASNQLNWQWVAGSGTDAAPYFRVFNPTTQGEKFDPQGDYVRRYLPELRGIGGKAVHQPWKLKAQPEGYPAPIVDHAHERRVALDRFARISRAARRRA
ncbi:cryptochrome/photolyase family protein [Amycolatopsis pithecellobii]|uniref:Deoxyribodipyrimidine photo-lyase n=1 Tax=Amycolatopsis pithecellobii TaxID=664692 RepID=A0A6N7Z5L2_9PSEU|nr:deoxyribodipyrimidine photo-lyase [Amycolatopsis pithecellobii]MTD56949.1 deoxyribodipyrimidine photo-lyase [Amycolatopsis pithecellobii]